jgi:hypothetical protein
MPRPHDEKGAPNIRTPDPLALSRPRRQRRGRRLRYYVSNRLVTGGRDPSGWRLPAPALEQAVVRAMLDHLDAMARRHMVLCDVAARASADASGMLHALCQQIRAGGIASAVPLIEAATLAPGRLHIALDRDAFAAHLAHPAEALSPDLFRIDAPYSCKRRGVEVKTIAGDPTPAPDHTLVRALRNAHRWAGMLKAGTSLTDIAGTEGFSESYVRRLTPLGGVRQIRTSLS